MPSQQATDPSNTELRVAELRGLLPIAKASHYRLIWIVGGRSVDRSALLKELSAADGCTLLDVGRGLSQALLDVSASLRPAAVEDCFAELLDSAPGDTACLDHLDVLFEPSLRLFPAELVRNASRHRTLVASWPGTGDSTSLSFGPSDHPAHRRLTRVEMECQFLDIDFPS